MHQGAEERNALRTQASTANNSFHEQILNGDQKEEEKQDKLGEDSEGSRDLSISF